MLAASCLGSCAFLSFLFAAQEGEDETDNLEGEQAVFGNRKNTAHARKYGVATSEDGCACLHGLYLGRHLEFLYFHARLHKCAPHAHLVECHSAPLGAGCLRIGWEFKHFLRWLNG